MVGFLHVQESLYSLPVHAAHDSSHYDSATGPKSVHNTTTSRERFVLSLNRHFSTCSEQNAILFFVLISTDVVVVLAAVLFARISVLVEKRKMLVDS